MTIFFRKLADFKKDASVDGLTLIWEAFYTAEDISEEIQNQWKLWFQAYAMTQYLLKLVEHCDQIFLALEQKGVTNYSNFQQLLYSISDFECLTFDRN